jgi:hypothetical protein
MNTDEQRTHTRKTDELDARLTNVETVVEALDQRMSELAVAAQAEINRQMTKVRELVSEERTHRLELAGEQRAYVDREDRELRRSVERLQVRTVLLAQPTVWRRLRGLLSWVLFGTC